MNPSRRLRRGQHRRLSRRRRNLVRHAWSGRICASTQPRRTRPHASRPVPFRALDQSRRREFRSFRWTPAGANKSSPIRRGSPWRGSWSRASEECRLLLILPCVRMARVKRGRLAQLVEHLVYTERVGGSSPSPPTSLLASGSHSNELPLRSSGSKLIAPLLTSKAKPGLNCRN